MFRVPKDIALKMVVKSYYFLQKNFIIFYEPMCQTDATRNSKKRQKTRKIATFWGQKLLRMTS